MKLSLVVMTTGKQEGKLFEVKLAQFVIGRDPHCHLRPASPMISKRHCAILQREGKAFLRDFGSTNGSFVNDEPVKGEVELKNADRLKIGPLLFTVQLETTAPAVRPTPRPAAEAAKPKPVAVEKTAHSGHGDDEIAAMLLALNDDDASPATAPDGPDGIPDGSTQMEILVPPGTLPDETPALEPAKEKPKSDAVNSSNAAKTILDKMMKRPRT